MYKTNVVTGSGRTQNIGDRLCLTQADGDSVRTNGYVVGILEQTYDGSVKIQNTLRTKLW